MLWHPKRLLSIGNTQHAHAHTIINNEDLCSLLHDTELFIGGGDVEAEELSDLRNIVISQGDGKAYVHAGRIDGNHLQQWTVVTWSCVTKQGRYI